MKRKTCLLLGLILVMICASALADVAINETNFPDESFRNYLLDFENPFAVDINFDGVLSDEELALVTNLDVTDKDIASLQGIEYFTALKYLYCGTNQLTSLDLSKNTELIYLDCSFNQLTSLDVSKNTALENLTCSDNQLTSLDLSKNTALDGFYGNNNQLTALDVSLNKALTRLACGNNQLISLDVSKNKGLEGFWCQGNQLSCLDVSNNPAIGWFNCASNKLKELDISRIPALCDLVKKNEPTEVYGGLCWEDLEKSLVLIVDKDIKLITGEAEKTDISKAKIAAIKDQVYTGKAIRPTVVVKYDGKKLIKDTDYTVTYKNNKKIGKATVTITGKGNYTGKKTVKFDIVPKAVKLSSLTAGKKELTIKWSKGSGITGYEIEYSLKKDFKDKDTVTIKKAATTKTVLKKLQAKKTYYVRIRAYKTVNGKKYYSAWSAIKNKKTK